jgi:glycosyltransferase involved in cell wall biosynthesis
VGDVTWNKNLPRLIQAIKKTKIPLVMIGKSLTQTDYDTTNKWNKDLVTVQMLIQNDKQIQALGFVPTEELVMLYNIASVFVMPSLYEGFGLPILEAMSSGCPVITSKEGSLYEVAGDAAFFIDAYDESSITDGIKKVFTDKNLQSQLSQDGKIQADKFSWKQTAEKTRQIYELIIR